jgi:hypothetical protein
MNNREAIKIISNYEVNGCGYCHQGGSEVADAFNLAISALEKQIPKRKLGKDQYNENLFTIRCPTCGALICNYNERLDRFSYMVKKNYCYICGQAIDFSKPQQEEQDG